MFNLAVVRTGTLPIGILKTPSLRSALVGISPQFERIQVDALTEAITNARFRQHTA
jgi:type VI secretion system protein VasG